MTDYSELKKAAEAAIESGIKYEERWPEGDDWFEPELISAEMTYVKAASPAVVLNLVLDVEKLSGCDKAYAEVWEKARALQSEMDMALAENERLATRIDDLENHILEMGERD
jgi:hypothetical protein